MIVLFGYVRSFFAILGFIYLLKEVTYIMVAVPRLYCMDMSLEKCHHSQHILTIITSFDTDLILQLYRFHLFNITTEAEDNSSIFNVLKVMSSTFVQCLEKIKRYPLRVKLFPTVQRSFSMSHLGVDTYTSKYNAI